MILSTLTTWPHSKSDDCEPDESVWAEYPASVVVVHLSSRLVPVKMLAIGWYEEGSRLDCGGFRASEMRMMTV